MLLRVHSVQNSISKRLLTSGWTSGEVRDSQFRALLSSGFSFCLYRLLVALETMKAPSKTVPLVFLFFTCLLALVLLLSKALHSRPKLNYILSEPAMVLLIGVVFSFLISYFFEVNEEFEAGDDAMEDESKFENMIFSFPSNIFFMTLLPQSYSTLDINYNESYSTVISSPSRYLRRWELLFLDLQQASLCTVSNCFAGLGILTRLCWNS
jgi:hypothetical protein